MEELILQIRKAIEYKLFYLSLFSVLALPDICGALESSDGKTSPDKYAKWYDSNIGNRYFLSGIECYTFRCKVLHQGTLAIKDKDFTNRIVFIEPTLGLVINNNTYENPDSKELQLHLDTFCNDMLNAIEVWLKSIQNDKNFIKNYSKFLKRYPRGVPRFPGMPAIY